MKISVCAPSYRRPKVLTLAYLPFCRVYVDPAEAAAYRSANPGAGSKEFRETCAGFAITSSTASSPPALTWS